MTETLRSNYQKDILRGDDPLATIDSLCAKIMLLSESQRENILKPYAEKYGWIM